MATKRRRRYTREFKESVVLRFEASSDVRALAAELEVSRAMLFRLENGVKNFADSGSKQRPIVSTLVHAILWLLAGASEVLHMDLIAEIWRRHLVSK